MIARCGHCMEILKGCVFEKYIRCDACNSRVAIIAEHRDAFVPQIKQECENGREIYYAIYVETTQGWSGWFSARGFDDVYVGAPHLFYDDIEAQKYADSFTQHLRNVTLAVVKRVYIGEM